MIKTLTDDHPMYKYASNWCRLDYTKDMKLVDLLELFELISGISGDNWEEVTIKKNHSNARPLGPYLVNMPEKGRDWYWCWSIADRIDRDQIDVFLTTEKQATYFAMAPTADIVEIEVDDILARIRARKNTGLQPKPGIASISKGVIKGL